MENRVVPNARKVIPPFGGDGGTTFSDEHMFKIKQIDVRHGAWLDGISVYFSDATVLKHGGDDGSVSSVNLESEEYITGVELNQNENGCIGKIVFYTSKGHKHGPFGSTDAPLTRFHFDERVLVGFTGRCGWYLDALGFILDSPE